jgi:hypothetical protein
LRVDWTDRTTAIGSPTVGRLERSIQALADDGHLIVATLARGGPGGPCAILVTVEPLTFDDGSPELQRFPSLLELTAVGDELAPLCMFTTSFPTFPQGQRPELPPGPLSVPLEQVGKIRPPGSIEVVGSLHGA